MALYPPVFQHLIASDEASMQQRMITFIYPFIVLEIIFVWACIQLGWQLTINNGYNVLQATKDPIEVAHTYSGHSRWRGI